MSSLRLTTQLQQKMVLTPQLRQRIEMLQMTSLELNDLIEQQMIENPILEEVNSSDEVDELSREILDLNADGSDPEVYTDSNTAYADGSGHSDKLEYEAPAFSETSLNGTGESNFAEAEIESDGDKELNDPFDEIDYGREFQDYLDPGYRTQEIEYKDDAPSFEQFLSHSPSLGEHLEWQVRMLDLSDAELAAAFEIIGNLDEDGRLTVSVDEICTAASCSREAAEAARQKVLRLDPVGCGALDVKECLLVQLDALGMAGSLPYRLVKEHFEDLQPNRLHHLANSTAIDITLLKRSVDQIKHLDPFPGRRYSSDQAVFVSPEVYIEKVDDDYVIYFADDGSPRLRISQTYQAMLNQPDTSKETKDFIRDKLRSAVDLLRNIEHRRQTIYRVVECIVKRQRDFLDKGVEYLKPMMLKDVAEDIGMHLSTVSRVVNRKYAHTPQGVIELRKFFSEGMLNEEGEEVSTRILKLKIKKLVEEENTKNPLTDNEIAKILSKDGVKLSRRTVAKYRDQMNIPGSRERRTVI